MERDDEPRHVEVELTSSDAGARTGRFGRRRRRSEVETDAAAPAAQIRSADQLAETPGTAVTAGREPPPVDGSRRLVAVGAAGLVVGLVGGWLVAGGGGGDDSVASEQPPVSATSLPTTEEPAAEASDDALEPMDTVRPTTTARRTTTTTLPEVSSTELHPLVAGTDLRLVAVRTSSEIVDIDAATGETVTTSVSGGVIDSSLLMVGADWLLTVSPGSGQSRILTDGGVLSASTVGNVWSLLPIPGTDLFWRIDEGAPSPSAEFEQVDLDGTPTGRTITGPVGWPAGVDPLGGVVFVVQGKSYVVDERGASLISEGEVLGLTAEVAVLRTCDEQLTCGLLVVDRVTGERRELAVDDEVTPGNQFFSGDRLGNALAPDGSALLVSVLTDDGVEVRLVDLESGADALVTTNFAAWHHAVWAPDSRAVLFVDAAGVPMVFDPATAVVEPLADGLTGWQRIAVRPAAT